MEEKEIKERILRSRNIMKYDESIETFNVLSDQELKKPQPVLCKEAISDEIIALPKNYKDIKIEKGFTEILLARKSDRIYSQKMITLLELSYMLFMTQGIKEIRGNNYATLRPVACGGARHEFETYLIVVNVEGLKPGKYHYLPMTHELEYLGDIDDIVETIDRSVVGQRWAIKSSVVFYWSITPYRCEWRYSFDAHRAALMDAGHVGQNMYLAATALGLGTCTLASFDRKYCDELFGLDGEDEFIVYAAPLGTL